ncbi:MAG: aspartate aminotransferase family protein [Thermodesulfobacteriota bacterium]
MKEHENATQNQEKGLLCPTYARYPLEIARGRGTKLYDPQGFEYTDLLAGIAVCGLGHCHPEISAVIKEQSESLIHCSNLFYQTPQLELAKALTKSCGLDRVFFCNSGAEANEAALKIARRYMQTIRGLKAHEIVSLEGSFHGRTLATLTLTGQDKVKEGYGPLPPGFKTVPFADIEAVEAALGDETAAVMVEIIQGEGGVRCLPREFLHELQALCRSRSCLFMVDEVQTGLGRTGKLWAHQHFDLSPDVLTTAKGLANGLPLGAMLVSEEVSQAFGPGSHATTFGGGPLVCAVGTRVLEIVERDGLCRRAAEIGNETQKGLQELKARFPDKIREVRGKGLMQGIELTFPAKGVWQSLLEKGFICNVVQDRTLRILPPLIISREEMTDFIASLEDVLYRQ